MDSSENPELGNFEKNILQISDTEDKGLDYDKIVERYGEGDLDLIHYAGDASKKTSLQPEDYIEQLEDTYQTLNDLSTDLDVDITVLPGNHAPISGAHTPNNPDEDLEYVEDIENILDEEYSDFSSFEGNAYEFLVEERYDNLTNIEKDSFDIEGLTIIGGTHHIGEETEREFLDNTPGVEQLEYDSEEIASDMTIKEPYDGMFANLPILGDIFSGLFSVERTPTPDEISLEDIPEGLEETDKHHDYRVAKEMLEDMSSMIEQAEEEVYLTHHGAISSAVDDFGSTVFDKLLEEYSENIALVGGGHTGQPGIDEVYDTPVVNTNNGAAIEIGIEEGEPVYTDMYDPTIDGMGSNEEQELDESQLNQMAQNVPEDAIPEELLTHVMDQQDLEREEAVDEIKKMVVAQNMNGRQEEAVA